MATYRTHGKEAILDILEEHPESCFSIEQIHAALGEKAPGLSTLYRLCAELVSSQEIQKFPDPDKNGFVFQFAHGQECLRHLHLQCSLCGRIVHLKCDMNDELVEHAAKDHGFEINCAKSVLYGLCAECQRKRIRL